MLMEWVVSEMQACSKTGVFYIFALFIQFAGGRVSGGLELMCTDLMEIITLATGLGTTLELKCLGNTPSYFPN